MVRRLKPTRALVIGRTISEGRSLLALLSFVPATLDLTVLVRRRLPVQQVALRTGLAPAVVEAFANGLASPRRRGGIRR